MAPFIATALLAVVLAGPAYAHGDKHSNAYDAEKVEQTSFGKAGDPRKATRTIRIAMTDDMRFSPDVVDVKQGETVKFIVSNNGGMMHELVIGTMRELNVHAQQMKKFPEMEHDAPYMVHVKPGKIGQIVWTFNRAGEFSYACLIAGHFEAGMVGAVRVAPKK